MVGGLADVPVHAGNEGGGAIEKILAVVKIEDGKTAAGLIVVAGREIDDEVALVSEEARAETFVLAEIGAAHGAMVTRRSLASTCCPGVTRSLVTRPEMGA